MRGRPARPPGYIARNEIAIRLATLIRMALQRRWLPPLEQLARELEVHPKTIRRDLAALEAAQVVLPVSTADGVAIEWRYVNHAAAWRGHGGKADEWNAAREDDE